MIKFCLLIIITIMNIILYYLHIKCISSTVPSIPDSIRNDNKIYLIQKSNSELLLHAVPNNFAEFLCTRNSRLFPLPNHEGLVQIMCKGYLSKANIRYRISITPIITMKPNIIILSRTSEKSQWTHLRDTLRIRNVSWKFKSPQLEISFRVDVSTMWKTVIN